MRKPFITGIINISKIVMFLVISSAFLMNSCAESDPVEEVDKYPGFPDFITANKDYFVLSKGTIPKIDKSGYSRAMDRNGNVQPEFDVEYLDGLNPSPRVQVICKE